MSFNPRTVYVKIGGSTITEKALDSPKPRIKRIRDFCGEVKDLVESGTRLIIAHGGGSYAHPFAARYRLKTGLKPENRIGVSKTRFWLTELSQIFLKEFIKLEHPAIVFHPSSLLYRSGDWISFTTPIKLALENGITPILMGDVVLDEEKGTSIISADDIPFLLLDIIDEVLFLVDVPGVLDKNGNLIKKICKDEISSLTTSISKSEDVTGGMVEKIKKAVILAERGKKVRISGYKKRGDLIKALKGLSGTEILPK